MLFPQLDWRKCGMQEAYAGCISQVLKPLKTSTARRLIFVNLSAGLGFATFQDCCVMRRIGLGIAGSAFLLVVLFNLHAMPAFGVAVILHRCC